ncbi:MAG: beta-N-acetylhexosaminidase [Paramuribaculum sp.]|nr:beta-N-acetylhexosaminidase [Paramuribaculum sp.]
MKKSLYSILTVLALILAGVAIPTNAAPRVNLTPWPQSITIQEGDFTLTPGCSIGIVGGTATEEHQAELTKFVKAINAATGLNMTVGTSSPAIAVTIDSSKGDEAYGLVVNKDNVAISAATPAGLYFALQSVKKMLPANVMAGKMAEGQVTYALPCVTIEDAPRFSFRSFMLDVSRHFYDVDQIKKMLDIMTVYKLNRFHWHLTDDQGWRLPMPKYPKLTQEGATHYNTLRTDFSQQKQWREGEGVPYGPYSYTEDEIREVVAYAKERHIEVIPEIDMPGHMVAAIHAYPEFSCNPDGSWGDNYTHEVWNKGGVSKDVLDVSNPAVQQFVKDVVDQLASLFPYDYIHIGGDECPTEAWSKSASIKAFKKENRLSSDTQVQTWFTKMIAEYALENYGKKICAWNELITNSGADMRMVRALEDPIIYCWYPATTGASTAQSNKLKHVYTPFNGGYYINRSYSGFDKVGAVNDGALSISYNHNPPENSYCIGVQGTFWCEQVDRPTDVEYLALPRLIALSEQGWTPSASKDYNAFMRRLAADTEMLKLAGYNYGAHQIVDPNSLSKPDPNKWYYMTSKCGDDRSGRIWELAAAGSDLLSRYGKAKVNQLWTNDTKDEENDYQLFRFVEDPANEGHYAIICKGMNGGSLNPKPTGVSTTGRWEYSDNVTYGFILDPTHYGSDNDVFHYSIRPIDDNGHWLNFSKSGQDYAINVYTNPADGSGGLMAFVPADGEVEPGPGPDDPVVDDEVPAPGKYYRLRTRFNGAQSQPRYGSCIELLRDDAGKGNNAQANRLWHNQPAEPGDDNYEYQWFTFEADPEGSGYYAIVCMAKPEGSVNSVPSVANNSNTARFDYDDNAKHYGFYLVESTSKGSTQGVDDEGFYSAITSKDAADGWYLNISAAGQGYSVHLYSDPTDQNAGIFTFEPYPAAKVLVTVKYHHLTRGQLCDDKTFDVEEGSKFTPEILEFEGLEYLKTEIEGSESLDKITAPTTVTLYYQDASGIDIINIDAADGKASIYDMSGRKLRAITAPGFYIVNGVKIFVK